jgi:hypothetical protein
MSSRAPARDRASRKCDRSVCEPAGAGASLEIHRNSPCSSSCCESYADPGGSSERRMYPLWRTTINPPPRSRRAPDGPVRESPPLEDAASVTSAPQPVPQDRPDVAGDRATRSGSDPGNSRPVVAVVRPGRRSAASRLGVRTVEVVAQGARPSAAIGPFTSRPVAASRPALPRAGARLRRNLVSDVRRIGSAAAGGAPCRTRSPPSAGRRGRGRDQSRRPAGADPREHRAARRPGRAGSGPSRPGRRACGRSPRRSRSTAPRPVRRRRVPAPSWPTPLGRLPLRGPAGGRSQDERQLRRPSHVRRTYVASFALPAAGGGRRARPRAGIFRRRAEQMERVDAGRSSPGRPTP